MAINKIQIDGNTLIDLSADTAVETDVASGKTFHKADGTLAIGTASVEFIASTPIHRLTVTEVE